MTKFNEIENILKEYEIKNYTIRNDGIVDVEGDVFFNCNRIEKIPIKFGIVSGDFICKECYMLKTLENAPMKCKKINCSWCRNLESLEGIPKECETLDVSNCINLEIVEHFPKKCDNIHFFSCRNLKTIKNTPKKCKIFSLAECSSIKTLDNVPPICGSFGIFNCDKLESLKGSLKESNIIKIVYSNRSLKSLKGLPEKCNEFHCYYPLNLKSLKDMPKECDKIYCTSRVLESLEGAPEKCKIFDCSDSRKLKSLKYAPKQCDIFDCSNCENLDFSFKYFPKCKEAIIDNTPFKEFHDVIGSDNFIKLINSDTDEEFDVVLLDIVSQKKIKLCDALDILKSEKYKHKYRGIKAGIVYNF